MELQVGGKGQRSEVCARCCMKLWRAAVSAWCSVTREKSPPTRPIKRSSLSKPVERKPSFSQRRDRSYRSSSHQNRQTTFVNRHITNNTSLEQSLAWSKLTCRQPTNHTDGCGGVSWWRRGGACFHQTPGEMNTTHFSISDILSLALFFSLQSFEQKPEGILGIQYVVWSCTD